MFNISDRQFERTVKNLEKLAGERLAVMFMDGAFWAFGSELSSLKLKEAYKDCEGVRAGYSEPFESHYFVLETKSFKGYKENDLFIKLKAA